MKHWRRVGDNACAAAVRGRLARWQARRGRGRVPDGGVRAEAEGADPWDREIGIYVDGATIARLQRMADESRDRIEGLLARAGYAVGTPAPRPAGVEARRDLDASVEPDMTCLLRIDELHEQRRSSPSKRKRQHAARVLTEALDRVVDGYEPRAEPRHRWIRAESAVDTAIEGWYQRLSLLGPYLARAAGWRMASRGALLCLALGVAALLAAGEMAWAAAAVAARGLLSVASSPRPMPAGRWHRLPRNPDWLGGAILNIGDMAIVAGTGAALHIEGRTAWGAFAVACSLFGLAATYVRAAAHQMGIRLTRLMIDRALKDVAITGSVVAAAIVPAAGAEGLVPVLAVPALAALAMGLVELARVASEVRRHSRRVRGAVPSDGELMLDGVAFTTDNDLVYQIPLGRRRTPIADAAEAAARGVDEPDHAPRLRVVHSGGRQAGP
jgi:hypothetical protein